MLGLRTQETRKSENFIKHIQNFAEKKQSVFFVFCSEGNEFETEKFDGGNLSGWLIPMDKAEEFNALYREWDNLDDWADYFRFAIWSGDKNNPVIEFKEY